MTEEAISVPTGLTTEGLIGRRYLARTIDTVCIILLAFFTALVTGLFLTALSPRVTLVVNLALISVVWLSYGAVLESSSWQATLGKRWMGLRVYNERAGRLTLPQAAGRNL